MMNFTTAFLDWLWRQAPWPAVRPIRPRGRARRRQARTTVVSSIVALFLLTGGFTAYVHCRPGFRDPLVTIKREVYAERVADKPEAVRVVVLGSSLSAAAVEPRTLAATVEAETGRPCVAFNLSAAGSGPVSLYLHARRLLEAGPVPDVAVIECLPAGFAWTAAGPHDATVLKADRLRWDEIDLVEKYGFPNADKLRERWLETMANPWTGFRFQVLVRVKPRWRPPELATGEAPRAGVEQGDGWGPWEPPSPAERSGRIAQVQKKYKPYLRNVDYDRPPAEAFRDTIRLLQAAGVRVVVATMPEAPCFRDWYPPGLDARTRAFLSGVGHGGDVPTVDTREWLPDEAFADGHHVLRDWAPRFTKRLVREAVAGQVRP
jgi:hypothetical protein